MEFEFNIKAEDVGNIIQKYYEEKENLLVDVNFYVDIRPAVYYTDSDSKIGMIKISGTIEAFDKRVSFSRNVSETELTEIFSQILEKEGFKLETLNYQIDSKDDVVKGININAVRGLEKTNKSRR